MSPSGEKPTTRRSNLPPLPRPVQEHLGQKLRAQYHEAGDKPKYLGDPMVPVAFDPLLEKMDKTERVRRAEKVGEAGRQAVATALGEPLEITPADRPAGKPVRRLAKHQE
ncbi:hypothetical protein [Microvirga brassicacearum]|uniref:Uncharacterized protein n=1 Tax=Microvirga brassicacearum TaxID=2580413 RepID=A0A5N3PCD2_9HYPH|nr:hypothetical protein [Microvirga brassicacearum]KAB0267361.1 hypothetical protein FEZ63_08585 [Microvirga brassicacearum]